MSETKNIEFPEWRRRESAHRYRARLREWYDSAPVEPGQPAFRPGEWDYICSLCGCIPDMKRVWNQRQLTMSETNADPLNPVGGESDADHRVRLRAWVDTIPRDPGETDLVRRSQWEYLCVLAEISPD